MTRQAFRTLFFFLAPVVSQAGAPAAVGILTQAPQILIVPIETPPLYFDFTRGTREAARELGLDLSGAGAPSASAPVVTVGPVVAAATSVVGVVHAIQAAKADTSLTWAVTNALSADGTWGPSRVVGGIVAAELANRGVTRVRVRDGVQPIPGVSRCENSLSGRSCWGPLDDYWRAKQTQFSYSAPDVELGTAVMEVSVQKLELSDDMLIFQVRLKLIAQDSGAVLARGAKVSWPHHLGKNVFANGGESFKTQFASLAQEATRKALEDFGL